MGTADQLMDLSVTRPYPGSNKLVERLLGIKEVSEKYRGILKELLEKTFTKAGLLKQIEAIEKATKEPLAKEKKAVEAQGTPAAEVRPSRRPGAAAAQPEDVRGEANGVGRDATGQQESGLRPARLRLWAAGRLQSARAAGSEPAHR